MHQVRRIIEKKRSPNLFNLETYFVQLQRCSCSILSSKVFVSLPSTPHYREVYCMQHLCIVVQLDFPATVARLSKIDFRYKSEFGDYKTINGETYLNPWINFTVSKPVLVGLVCYSYNSFMITVMLTRSGCARTRKRTRTKPTRTRARTITRLAILT